MSTTPERDAGALPPAGWYPDPAQDRSRRHDRRFWDGTDWTPQVADGALVTTDPLPPPRPDTRTALPGRAAWVALAGFVVAQLLALTGLWLGVQLAPDTLLVRLLLSQAGLWTGLLGACTYASRRWGTGSLRADFGLTMKLGDVGRGLLIALGARIASAVVVGVLLALAPRLVGTNSGIFEIAEGDRAALLVLAALAVIGAPLVEETFFRGLLLQSLRCRLGAALAVPVQGVAFALTHYTPSIGWGNVGLLLGLVVAGVALGMSAEHYRRLGPSIWAHAAFNAMPVVFLLAGGDLVPVPSQPPAPGS